MSRDDPLTYCRSVLLPIWERWTDGHPSMRRALDCESADPRTHQERREALMAIIAQLMVREGQVGTAAAVLAGMAALAALESDTGSGYERMCRWAVEGDSDALGRLPRE